MGIHLLNSDDFESIVITVKGKNVTSGLVLRELIPVEIQEIGEEGIVLSMTSHSCAQGHHLELDFFVSRGEWRENQKVTAKVLTTESCGSGADRVCATLIQYDSAGWSRWIAVMTGRQTEIEQYFARVKDVQ